MRFGELSYDICNRLNSELTSSPEFGIQRHAQVFGCVLVWNNVVVDIDWLVLDTLVGEIDVH
jgi:hypothetical protein